MNTICSSIVLLFLTCFVTLKSADPNEQEFPEKSQRNVLNFLLNLKADELVDIIQSEISENELSLDDGIGRTFHDARRRRSLNEDDDEKNKLNEANVDGNGGNEIYSTVDEFRVGAYKLLLLLQSSEIFPCTTIYSELQFALLGNFPSSCFGDYPGLNKTANHYKEDNATALDKIFNAIESLIYDPKRTDDLQSILGEEPFGTIFALFSILENSRASVEGDPGREHHRRHGIVYRLYIRQVINNILDYPHVREWANELVEKYGFQQISNARSTDLTEDMMKYEIRSDQFSKRQISDVEDRPSFYRTDDSDIQNLELESTGDLETSGNARNKASGNENLVAFFLSGLPLRPRIDTPVEKSVTYLYKNLKAAGIDLYLPVESFISMEWDDNINEEPFLLGVRRGNLRATHYNMSNAQEVKSFMEILSENF